jgi:hypothetical protein
MSDWQTKRLSTRIGGGQRFGQDAEKGHTVKEDPAVILTDDAVKLQKRNKILGDSGWTLAGSGIQEWKIPSISEKKFASFEATYGVEYLVNTSASVVVTLPAAKKNAVIVIKDCLGQAVVNPIQVKARGAEKIDGYTSKWINADYWSLTLVSDGSNWFMKNQVDGTMLNQVTLAAAASVDIDWSMGDTFKLAVDAGTTAAVTVTHSNVADKVIIIAVQNTSSTAGLALTLPAALGNSSLSSTTMPVTVDAASWSIFTWFNMNAGTVGSGNLFVSGVENLS